jgi:hypothetical protein
MTDRTSKTVTASKPLRARRMARPAADAPGAAATTTAINIPAVIKPTKLAMVEDLLRRPGGASIAELVAATGWQQHSVRGAMAGALRKRGLVITSDKVDGVRRYCAGDAA